MMKEFIELGAILVLLVLSYIFSGSEVAIFSLSEIDRLKIAREKSENNFLILKYLGHPQKLLVTILIGNNLVNFAASILGGELSRFFFTTHTLFLSVFIMTSMLLLFGEILPKNIAASRPAIFSRRFITIIDFTNKLFLPLIFIMTRMVKKSEEYKSRLNLSSEELVTALEKSDRAGLDQVSINTLKNLVHLIDKPATDIMVPRFEIKAVDINDYWTSIEKFIKESPLSMVLFYRNNIDNIIGYKMKNELIGGASKKKITKTMRKPIMVPESKTVLSLLSDFKEQQNYLAVILDEYGGTVGLVTLKDILDSIFIKDILVRNYIRKTSADTWMVYGNTKISDLNYVLGTQIPPEHNTISGYISNVLGVISEDGTRLDIIEGFQVTVLRSEEKQINLLEFKKVAF